MTHCFSIKVPRQHRENNLLRNGASTMLLPYAKKEPLPLSHIYKNELKMGHGSNIRTKSRKCLEEI